MKDNATIISIDIEVSPLVAYTWGPKYETNIIEVKEDARILSFSAKYLEGKQTTKGLIDYKGYRPGKLDDKKIMKDIWNILDEADIILAHNGRAFDTKTINSRFAFHEMTPPSPYKTIDTLLEARKYLKLPSYAMNDLCTYFGIGKKLEHEGFPLWKKCMEGDEKAWARMLKYNKKDVKLLEDLYLKLRPFMKTHQPVGMFTGKVSCPTCGGTRLQSRGYAVTKVRKYRRMHCQDCGSWSRYTESEPNETNKLVGV